MGLELRVTDSRRAFRIVEPGEQLRLPLWLLFVSLFFLIALVWNGYAAYERMADSTLTHAPTALRESMSEQTYDFLVVSGVILVAWVSVVMGICVSWSHRLIGPRVALMRQVEALKNGDYSRRVHLRSGDHVFEELARDLNDLAQILERGEKRRAP